MNKEKTTEFEGFMSGDYECFCLSKIPFSEWVKVFRERGEKNNYPYPDPLLMYPDTFFPKPCNEGKWKFKITVEATPISKEYDANVAQEGKE